jgi:hypothetical protein
MKPVLLNVGTKPNLSACGILASIVSPETLTNIGVWQYIANPLKPVSAKIFARL